MTAQIATVEERAAGIEADPVGSVVPGSDGRVSRGLLGDESAVATTRWPDRAVVGSGRLWVGLWVWCVMS
ncbi:hypothetical protein ACFYXQ_38920 [Nocardia jiangxiensis]|uniref:Uncharacterized protein n=1 Tax=Nocardia jiangxiensis TaxID=282685 RepID=A0ABW6SBR3_9NOCA